MNLLTPWFLCCHCVGWTVCELWFQCSYPDRTLIVSNISKVAVWWNVGSLKDANKRSGDISHGSKSVSVTGGVLHPSTDVQVVLGSVRKVLTGADKSRFSCSKNCHAVIVPPPSLSLFSHRTHSVNLRLPETFCIYLCNESFPFPFIPEGKYFGLLQQLYIQTKRKKKRQKYN